MGNSTSRRHSKILVETADNPLAPINYDTPVRVENFVLRGVGKTKDELIVPIVKELFLSSTFGELVARSEHVAQRLEGLDCFEKVRVTIDTNKDAKSSPEGLKVILDVDELSWMELGGSFREHPDGMQGEVGLRLPNLMGGGEKLTGAIALGNSHTASVSFSKPLVNRSSVLHSSFASDTSRSPCSSYEVNSNTVLSGIAFDTYPQWRHDLVYEYSQRVQQCLVDNRPQALLEGCRETTKSSLHHKIVIDMRRPKIGFPLAGSYFTTSQELAGFGGDIGFIKANVQGVKAVPLMNNLMTGQLETMWKVADKKVCPQDLLYLGGSTSLRGFEQRGVGPHREDLAIGGDISYATGMHLYYRIPSKTFAKRFGDNLRLHGFVNSGSLAQFHAEEEGTTTMKKLLKTSRIAWGLGLSMKLGELAQLELNYCVPVRAFDGDKTSQGFQCGIGINFI